MRYTTIAQVKAANKAAGQFWFGPDTMRYWNSRVESDVIGGRYFLTSERSNDYDDARRYSIREAMLDGSIETRGDFRQYDTKAEAKHAAMQLLKADAYMVQGWTR